MDLRAAAVRENARWCALVSGWHGVKWTEQNGLAVAVGPPPPSYPGAVTLRPALRAADVAASGAPAVKDSYADLDLAAGGYTELFAARWIGRASEPGPAPAHWRTVDTPGDLAAWRAAHGSADALTAAVLAEPSVAVLARDQDGTPAGGAVAHRDDETAVIGLSNVFGAVSWADLVGAACDRLGALPVVGYERGAALDDARAAGFADLGPLRVWVRRPFTPA